MLPGDSGSAAGAGRFGLWAELLMADNLMGQLEKREWNFQDANAEKSCYPVAP